MIRPPTKFVADQPSGNVATSGLLGLPTPKSPLGRGVFYLVLEAREPRDTQVCVMWAAIARAAKKRRAKKAAGEPVGLARLLGCFCGGPSKTKDA